MPGAAANGYATVRIKDLMVNFLYRKPTTQPMAGALIAAQSP